MSDRLLDATQIARIVASIERESPDAAAELLRVLDANGEPLGVAPRLLCHRLGLLHRAVFCFIGAPDGTLLLQTRKDGRLDVAVGGHMSIKDKTVEDAILREVVEETSLTLGRNRLTKITEYERRGIDRLSKPRDINNELRTLFFATMSEDECKLLDNRFLGRTDKEAVLSVGWFRLRDVLTACDADQAADGLTGSIAHYLIWRKGYLEDA